MKSLKGIIASGIALVLLAACSDSKREFYAEFDRVSDSLRAASPSVGKLIDEELKNAKDSDEYYCCLLHRAQYLSLSDPDSMNKIVDRVMPWLDKKEKTPRLHTLYGIAEVCKASYFMSKGQYDSVKVHAERGYDNYFVSNRKKYLPVCCSIIGSCESLVGNHLGASRWFRRGMVILDSLHLPRTDGAALYQQMAMTYMTMGDNDEAEDLLKQMEHFVDSVGMELKLQHYNNYAALLIMEERYDESLKKLKVLDDMLGKNRQAAPYFNALCYVNMAGAYFHLDSLDKARQCADSAEVAFKKIGLAEGLLATNTVRLGIATEEGQLAKAAQYAAATSALANSNDITTRQEWMRMKQNYYLKCGDYHNAYLALKQFSDTNDSVRVANGRLRAIDLQEQFRSDRLAMQNQLLLKEKSEHKMKTLLWAIVALGVICSLVAFLIIKNLTWKRRHLKSDMDNLRLQLEKTRSQISPHFIFNAISTHLPDKDDKQYETLMRLTKLIRSNLDNARKEEVSLREEIGFVNDYVDVQRTMIDGELDYTVDVKDESLLDTTTLPSMFVQILAENALIHGLKGKEGEKRLSISVDDIGGKTRIAVQDNGRGFDIRRYNTDNRGRLGLNIIRNTVSILNRQKVYNGDMSFDITNTTGDDGKITGCRCSLIIPRQGEGGCDE